MKNLSHLLMAVIVTSISLSSCKKSSTPIPSTSTAPMKITANGNNITFNDCEEGSVDVGGSPQATFIGVNITNGKAGDATFEIDILHDPATLKVGQTYPVATAAATADHSGFFYYPDANNTFVTQPGNPQGSVTITGVTSTTISGTFSCKLFATNDFTGTTVLYTITNGSFTAKINK